MKNVFSISPVLTLLFLAGCRFSSPSVQEQQELIKRGHFPERMPAWVSRPAQMGHSLRRDSVGIVPETFGNVGQTLGQSTTGISRQEEDRDARMKQIKKVEERRAALDAKENPETQTGEDSPLSRVEKQCPNLEAQVVEAITTTEVATRRRKLLSLTQRCPLSWDLWMWLGKAYLKENRSADAEHCFKQVVILDSQNKEAQELLNQLKDSAAAAVTAPAIQQ